MDIWKIIIAVGVVLLGGILWRTWSRNRSLQRAMHTASLPGDVVMPVRSAGQGRAALPAASSPEAAPDAEADAAPRIPLSAVWKPQPPHVITELATMSAPVAAAPEAAAVAALASAPHPAPHYADPPPVSAPPQPARRVPSRAACRLGAHFLHFFLDAGAWLPGGRALYTAEEAYATLALLERGEAFASLPHGAVICRINPGCVLLIDPLLSAVEDAPRTIDAMVRAAAGAQVYVVLGQLSDDVHPDEPPRDAHIPAALRALNVSPPHLFYAIEDGSYHSDPEVDACFVPSRVDVEAVPARFVGEMIHYCLERLTAQEPEASRRVLGPIIDLLLARAQAEGGGFDTLTLARAFNVLGLANRDMGDLPSAITCLQTSLDLALPIGTPDDLHILYKNLAEVLITFAPTAPNPDYYLRAATDNLQHVTQIAPDDLDAALALGCTFMDRYRCTGKRTMLQRATLVLSQVLKRAPGEPALVEAIQEANALLAAHDQRQRDADAPFKPAPTSDRPDWAKPPRITLRPSDQSPPPQPNAQRHPVHIQHHTSEQRRKPTNPPANPSDSTPEPASHDTYLPRRVGVGSGRAS